MYNLDPQAARKADTTGGMITEIGKYVGTFTQAVDVTASTGTKGIALAFQSTAGQKARISLYTQKSNGEKLMGFDALSAIMTCLSLRSITPKPGVYLKWNPDTKADDKVQGEIFPDLCGKPIGVLLETEDYPKNNGGTGTRMVLKGIFQANTELTASEILDKKTTPEQLPRMVQSLRHRPIRGTKPAATHAHSSSGPVGSGFEDMDDDIPFITASSYYDMTTSKARRMAKAA